jgi:DNA polymerase V
MAALKHIFKEGYEYKKAGVIVTGIVPCNAFQQNLFDQVDRAKQQTLMDVFDSINEKLGKDPVKLAIQNFPCANTAWLTQRSKLSSCYTTRWADILKAG